MSRSSSPTRGGLGAVSMSAVAERARLHADVALPLRHGQGRPGAAHAGARHRRPARVDHARRRAGGPGLDAWTRETVDIYVEHPWMLDIPISSTPVTPNNLAWLEVALQVLAAGARDDERQGLDRAGPHRAGALGGARRAAGYTEAAAAAGSTPDDLEIAATGDPGAAGHGRGVPVRPRGAARRRVLTGGRRRQPVRLRAASGCSTASRATSSRRRATRRRRAGRGSARRRGRARSEGQGGGEGPARGREEAARGAQARARDGAQRARAAWRKG